ncbi:hypothetical protein B0T21DRAFT_384303 [Apiosordaria backusii]|uniref:Methyltransferase type 11 domain-containing protein n=1 Tax=Apiosordaria backusii TaxID=314023 RepID=A0AA40BJQ4_9PEZI|nr:hypothetical protein B0T21DRAFT_384303 [Apiosordaria backusii]
MASRRPGPKALGRSGDLGVRSTGAQMETPKAEIGSRPSWRTKQGPDASHEPSRTIPQPKTSSRLPMALSHRRPSDGQLEPSRLGQQSHFRASIGSPSTLGLTVASGSTVTTSITSSRLPAPSSKPRNILRRKRSGLVQDTANRFDLNDDSTRTSSSDSDPRSLASPDLASLQLDRELTQSPMEIRIAHQIEIAKTTAQPVTIYPELDRYGDNVLHRLATHDLPPPTPLFSGNSSQVSGFSGSPSTRWSESPGPGPYSRDTTPTSISSQSPGLVAPLRIPPPSAGRLRQTDLVQTRPPVTRRRTGSISNEVECVSADPQGLPVVRELSNSSSSNSTVRAGTDGKEKKKKSARGLSSLPPTPPPRKSSHKSNGSRDEGQSPFQPAREAGQPRMTSPSPVKATSNSRPRPVTSPRSTPPVRPSRDGTLDLQVSLGQTIPVVHSNLSSTSLSDRRHSALLTQSPANRPPLSSSLPDRPSYLSRRPPAREATPAPRAATFGDVAASSKPEPGRATRTPSPGVSAFKTRFTLFGRRTKTVPEPGQEQEKKDKAARKGPAAGTGHEGYGRLGHARRRSSTTLPGRVIPGTMSSQESVPGDSFLAERMAPVIIAGGEIVENRNASSELTRTESSQSISLRRPSIESRNSSQISLSSREPPRNSLWPSPIPRGVTPSPAPASRRPSASSVSEAQTLKPTLALRRSMQRLKSGEQEPPRLPKPIVTRPQVVSPSLTSLDASIMSDDSIFDPSIGLAKAKTEPAASTTSAPKKLIKRSRSPRKWNFFGRSHSQPAAEKQAEPGKPILAAVEAPPSKPVAFYTLIDSSEPEDAETPDLEEVLREAKRTETPPVQPAVSAREEKRQSTTQIPAPQTTAPSSSIAPKRTVTSPANISMMPTAPARQPERPVMPPPRQAPPRPSRLPQVGRIPKVVSARTEQLSPPSFSRPFNRRSIQASAAKPILQDADSVATGSKPPQDLTPELVQHELTEQSISNISALIYGIPRLSPVDPNRSHQEFLSFSPRKNSQCTTTSSSSSGGFFNYAEATAVVPDPNAPLVEDEIWDEYNDLLGDDTIRFSAIGGKAWPKPLRLEGSSKGNSKRIEPALESPTLSPPPLPSLVQTLRAGMEQTSSSVYTNDMAEEVRRALDTGMSICVSIPTADIIAVAAEPEKPEPAPQADNTPVQAHQTRNSSGSCSSQSSEEITPTSQVNLRVGSMTVSKWLTFGHVLFSPIRDELIPDVGSLKRPSILVVDGLGNDDWSFYAAETYPAATFFNLSPRAPLPAEPHSRNSTSSSATIPLSPPNHHQIQYLSHLDKFPFGAQSFTAVVFRFPAAGPESHYRNIISEARRVLKPGGFIELSILDVDFNNMGNRGRRAVRRLKERIHARAPDTSLGSTSDLILRLINRKGFTDVKTCRVGIPVASPATRSSRVSFGGSGVKSNNAKKDERSLPELMSEEGPVADESITSMVAKVGRWWYTRCYESAGVGNPGAGWPGSKESMWRDKGLVKECEEWGTSLKLMVCYGRVPDGNRARVASI